VPLGVVASQDFEKECNRLGATNGSRAIIIVEQEKQETHLQLVHGRGNGRTEVPEKLRELIASEAIAGASAKELSEQFNVSQSSISAYKNGATSTSSYHSPDESLAQSNTKVRNEISGAARAKLMDALANINFGANTKPNIASAVARDMSTIMKNVTPDAALTINNKTIVFAPRMKEEDDYEVIDVKDE